MSIGVVSILSGFVIMVIVTFCGETLGFGTLASMILTGVFIDLIMIIDVIPKAGNMAVGIAMLVAGMLILSLGSYFYMNSAFGVGPRDNLMVVLNRKTKLPVGVCRSAVEIIATLTGWLLGGMVGIGTIISAAAIGFCIQATFAVFKFNVTAVKHETLKQTLTALQNRYSNRDS
jgi:uncharacterized membrane protein YczE